MICPQCGSEYRDGYTRCDECDVALIEAPPPAAEPPDKPLVKVYESSNAAVTPVIQSLFRDAGIEYMAKGEPIEELFGTYAFGPVEFYVSPEDEDAARSLLQSIEVPEVEREES